MSNKEIRNRILSGIFIVTAITRGFLPPLTADIVVSLVALVILLKVVRDMVNSRSIPVILKNGL